MMTDPCPALISQDWLKANLRRPSVRILDASFFLPNQGRKASEEYQREHIQGALFFDIDAIADRSSDLPHMLPSPEQFADAAGELGIANDTHVVVYDNNSFMASARVWWTFRVFGHERVSVLDGGLKRWKAMNWPLEERIETPKPKPYRAQFRADLLCTLDQVMQRLEDPNTRIIDARSAARFAGTEVEPRPGLRSGHIPQSYNLPFAELVDAESFCLKSAGEIAKRFDNLGISLDKSLITSCGSGVTASILALALYCIGKTEVAVYDGSWSEWGTRADTPIESEQSSAPMN